MAGKIVVHKIVKIAPIIRKNRKGQQNKEKSYGEQEVKERS